MKVNIFVFSSIILLFTSCYSNSIYFDIKDQAIKSCNPTGISQIYIENYSLNDYYSVAWSDSVHSAPGFINMKNIQNGFTISVSGGENKQIPSGEFKLRPSTEYTITKDQGDASSYEIKVWTNSKGYIIGTTRPDCQ
ncbi:MAG TPA: hypothetical protein VFE53_12045 [Mucilaginibacter sp.]|jgi:hypothetical protein|nr:hypothetical protein [Mucilaginibacter sp.]